jgi:hypothetical protein
MIEFFFEVVLELILEGIAALVSLIFRGVSKLFSRTPKRWDRLDDTQKARLEGMREKRREKLERKFAGKKTKD